jgi:OmpA-OmpF porin, OOP family
MSSNDNLSEKIANEINETAESSGSLIKRMLPLFLLILIASLLWMFFNKSCVNGCTPNAISHAVGDTSTAHTAPEPDSQAIKAKALWAATLGDNIEIKLPDGTIIKAPKNGFEVKLIEFLNNGCKGDLKKTWFNCDRLLFHTGSNELNEVSKEQIDGLAYIFKAYPNAKFRIGGYTDNVGNPASNLKLSSERATTVMNSIIAAGVASEKLKSEGYGQEHPDCAANDTEECRAKNRRVAIRVEQCN